MSKTKSPSKSLTTNDKLLLLKGAIESGDKTQFQVLDEEVGCHVRNLIRRQLETDTRYIALEYLNALGFWDMCDTEVDHETN